MRLLLEAGADPSVVSNSLFTPMYSAVESENFAAVSLLSSYGARRCSTMAGTPATHAKRIVKLYERALPSWTNESEARHRRAELLEMQKILSFLELSSEWTPLAHLEELTEARCVTMLRGGASLHRGSPTPLERAKSAEDIVARAARPETPESLVPPLAHGPAVLLSVADLIVRASGPWSPFTHHLFPEGARARARSLLFLGAALSRDAGGEAFKDVWVSCVIPAAVSRESASSGGVVSCQFGKFDPAPLREEEKRKPLSQHDVYSQLMVIFVSRGWMSPHKAMQFAEGRNVCILSPLELVAQRQGLIGPPAFTFPRRGFEMRLLLERLKRREEEEINK